MANSGFLLKGARGKVGDLVLQKGEKGTIMRTFVKPSNPRTAKQMAIRQTFSVVAKAGAALADLVGISFQGVDSKVKSKRRFRAINNSRVYGQIKQGNYNFRFAPKYISTLIPNAYQVSQGSVSSALLGEITVNDTAHRYSHTSRITNIVPGQDYTPQDFLKLFFNCNPGDQITVVGIAVGYQLDTHEETNEILREGDMRAARVVFKNDYDLATLTNFNVPVGTDVDDVPAMIQDYIVDLVDSSAGKTYASFLQLISMEDGFSVTSRQSGAIYEVSWNPKDVVRTGGYSLEQLLEGAGGKVMALAYFRSSYDDGAKLWRYSNSSFIVIEPVYTQQTFNDDDYINYGYQYETALATYLGASGQESDKFTQTGGSQNALGF